MFYFENEQFLVGCSVNGAFVFACFSPFDYIFRSLLSCIYLTKACINDTSFLFFFLHSHEVDYFSDSVFSPLHMGHISIEK